MKEKNETTTHQSSEETSNNVSFEKKQDVATTTSGSFFDKPSAWALLLGLSLIVCSSIITDAFKSHSYSNAKTVSATGQGTRQMRSDWSVWTGTITAFDPTSKETCAQALEQQRQAVSEYLKKQGIADTTFEFSSITVCKEEESNYNSKGDYIGTKFKGYEMTQEVTVKTSDIDKVKLIARDITSLISEGIDISSHEPSYYILNLGDLKLSLIDEATENAKARARKLIKGFAKLQSLASTDAGVFQITGLHSDDDYSYGGSYNTTSEWKEVSVTVHAKYFIK